MTLPAPSAAPPDLMQELSALIEKDPQGVNERAAEALKELMKQDPERGMRILRVLASTKWAKVAAGPFCFEGFEAYFLCIFGWLLPKHAHPWVTAFFEEWNSGKKVRGLMIKGFRGSTKSTVAIGLATYITGHYPYLSGMNVQKSEDDARPMSKMMADIIELNPGWKMVFPHVVPDRDRGWSVEGYHVKDTRVDYGEWIQKVQSDHGRDPSLLAVSVTSGAVGKHPSGWILFDDIHDYKNTSSRANMAMVVNTVKADILPTLMRPGHQPFVLWAYTPWDEDDVYAFIERSGMFRQVSTPAWRADPDGTVEWEGEKGVLAWPSEMGLEEMEMWRRTEGPAEFARMILCDLTKAANTLFKWYTFPHEQIDPRWMKAGGVDYASINMPTRQVAGDRSHFAEAVVTKSPWNTIIVQDGYVAQITQTEAEQHVMSTQEGYKMTGAWKTTVIESNGKGEEFIALMRRNQGFNVLPNSVGVAYKPKRLAEMMPWMENGVVLVSDADTPFLNTFRKFMELYPNIDKHDKMWDVADSVWHALHAFPECLTLGRKITTARGEGSPWVKEKKKNPFVIEQNWSGLHG
jgi:hypothetical protein